MSDWTLGGSTAYTCLRLSLHSPNARCCLAKVVLFFGGICVGFFSIFYTDASFADISHDIK